MMPISAETKRHKRQDCFQDRINGVATGLEQYRHGGAHSHTDFCQQPVALLGDFFCWCRSHVLMSFWQAGDWQAFRRQE